VHGYLPRSTASALTVDMELLEVRHWLQRDRDRDWLGAYRRRDESVEIGRVVFVLSFEHFAVNIANEIAYTGYMAMRSEPDNICGSFLECGRHTKTEVEKG